MAHPIERESIDYDVAIVGGGPAGLSAAIRLKQRAAEQGSELSVVLLEKGSEIGAHILSGAVFETRALDELLPDWRDRDAPLTTAVSDDHIYWFQNERRAWRLPNRLTPKTMHNQGNYIISLGNLCRWLAQQAEALGVEIFPGFAAAQLLEDGQGRINGVITSDLGIGKEGEHKADFEPGMAIRAKYTLFAEGCRGHLGKQLIAKYALDAQADIQHYAIGIKELWEIPAQQHHEGRVVHGAGWPLSETGASGGSFLYHAANCQVMVGLITDLNYRNPYLSPFEEFQRFKHHPVIAPTLQGAERISYGARAIAKGGLNALPRQHFPGGLLLGCDAGTLNFAKIKGSHTAMKSGMLGADVVFDALASGDQGGADLAAYDTAFRASWLYDELHASRNFGAALHRYGAIAGGAWNVIEHNLFGGKLPITLHDHRADHESLMELSQAKPIHYPKPDQRISFDRLSSVSFSNTNHEEDQPVHLRLTDAAVPVTVNLAKYGAPEQRYCPAGVYEILEDDNCRPYLQINAQNCVHCKTCDIKDPTQNITWVNPEGAGGPNYPNM